MADQIKFNPYQSQVPLVQPPAEMYQPPQPAQPQPGMFGGKGTGALAIGDSIVKGFLQGHALRAQKQAEQATATINAAQGAETSAWAQYQDALAQGKAKQDVNDPFYQTYLKAHNQTSTILEQYAIPPKGSTTKKEKGAQKKAENDEAKPQTFGQRIKDFIQANPHIIPQLAIATRVPNPPTMTPNTVASQQRIKAAQTNEKLADIELAEAQRKVAAEKVYDVYSGLTPEQLAALPPEQQQQFRAAKNTLYAPKETGTPKLYTSPDGQVKWVVPGQEPEGWNAIPVGTGMARPGSPQYYVETYAKENGIPVDKLTTADLDYINQMQAWDRQQGGSSTSTRWVVDNTGHYVALPSITTKGKGTAPQPPSGRKPLEFGAPVGLQPPPTAKSVQGHGLSAPPTSDRKSTRTGMAPPPGRKSGVESFSGATNKERVETQKTDHYQKANTAYNNQLKWIEQNAAKQPEGWAEEQKKKALSDLATAKVEIGKWYAQQQRAIGGNAYYQAARDPKTGETYETTDGKTWRNVITGKPLE